MEKDNCQIAFDNIFDYITDELDWNQIEISNTCGPDVAYLKGYTAALRAIQDKMREEEMQFMGEELK